MSDQEQIDWSIFDTLTVDCQLTEKDMGAGYSLYWRSAFKLKKILIYFSCFIATYYTAGILINGGQTDFDFFNFLSTFIGLVVFVLAIGRIIGRRRTKGFFRERPSSRRPARFGWDTNGFYFSNATSRIFHPWSDFQSWAEDKRNLALLFAGPMFIPLPKRTFTDQQLADLKAHIEASALPKARLFPI